MTDETEVCTQCLAEDVPAGAKRCMHCGKRMSPLFTRHLIVLLIVVVLAVGAVGAVLKGNSDANRHACRNVNSEMAAYGVPPDDC